MRWSGFVYRNEQIRVRDAFPVLRTTNNGSNEGPISGSSCTFEGLNLFLGTLEAGQRHEFRIQKSMIEYKLRDDGRANRWECEGGATMARSRSVWHLAKSRALYGCPVDSKKLNRCTQGLEVS
jgi:hypothetical protein